MQRVRREFTTAPVPLASMIDMVFLLLTFFILTFQSTIPEARMELSMPGPDPHPRDRVPVLLTMSVLPGQYQIHGMNLSFGELEQRLSGMTALDPSTTVRINVSQEAQEGELVRLLDLCHRLKLTRLNVLTLKDTAGR